MISHHLILCLLSFAAKPGMPSKPTDQPNRAALGGLGLKGLSLKPDFLKNAKATAAAAMDDSVETKRNLETLGDMPVVDMTMAEGEVSVGDLEVDDNEEANRMDQALTSQAKHVDSMEIDDEDIDLLDAFMTGVKEDVKKVNVEDMKKVICSAGHSHIRLDERMAKYGTEDTANAAAWLMNWTQRSSTQRISWHWQRRRLKRKTLLPLIILG